MSPKPFVEPDPTDRFHHDDCRCAPCATYREQHPPRMSWVPIRRAVLFSLPIIIAFTILGLWVASAQAREGAIHPVPIPAAHAKARAVCPLNKPLECRAALIHAYEAVAWQQEARRNDAKRAKGYGVNHALRLAAALYGVPLGEMRAVGNCESHLHPLSKNRSSTAAGVFQFLDSTWARAGLPGFSVYDAYANILAAARLVKTDGSWREWSCQP